MDHPASVPGVRDTVVLVPAAGRGERLGVGAPKALRHLAGEPLLLHAVRRLAAARSVSVIVVAAPPGDLAQVKAMFGPAIGGVRVIVVAGGPSRQRSVALALDAAPPGVPIVLVHDAARPLTPPDLVDEVAAAVRAGHDVVVPVLPVVDTIRSVGVAGTLGSTVDRSTLRAVQTPQGFRRTALAAAHESAATDEAPATDDAGLAERLGLHVWAVPGRAEALKVTTPFDLFVAEALLRGALTGPAS